MKPKPQNESRFRGERVHGWIEVDSTPFDGGPRLPACRRCGTAWPAWAENKWDAWRSMPHARLWSAPDWEFALDTLELTTAAFEPGAKVGLLGEVRLREQRMGTTWSARQDMRIKCVEQGEVDAGPATVTSLRDYQDL